jgi:hypothetical protein
VRPERISLPMMIRQAVTGSSSRRLIGVFLPSLPRRA